VVVVVVLLVIVVVVVMTVQINFFCNVTHNVKYLFLPNIDFNLIVMGI
jgi:hypothetical protein